MQAVTAFKMLHLAQLLASPYSSPRVHASSLVKPWNHITSCHRLRILLLAQPLLIASPHSHPRVRVSAPVEPCNHTTSCHFARGATSSTTRSFSRMHLPNTHVSACPREALESSHKLVTITPRNNTARITLSICPNACVCSRPASNHPALFLPPVNTRGPP